MGKRENSSDTAVGCRAGKTTRRRRGGRRRCGKKVDKGGGGQNELHRMKAEGKGRKAGEKINNTDSNVVPPERRNKTTLAYVI